MTRQTILDDLRSNPDVSVLIIGGGINGIGLLRELALQHVDALLIDKSDYCAGASAASTRIIHGGLRYLENGEFRLVQEALYERNLLLQNAPHYVSPLPTTIPIFSWASGMFTAARMFLGFGGKPKDRGALLIKVGLMMYDFFSRRLRQMPLHRFASRKKALAQRPELNPSIVCTATYYDARIGYPERLCLELILDAEAIDPQARALNYVRVERAQGDVVTLVDEVSGETLEVKPKIVVNATGAWIDFTNRALERHTDFIGGTKGAHLMLRHPELVEATKGEMLYFANKDGRVCIFYPFYNTVIAGSTDIPIEDPETARCDDEETEYLLESVRQVFPTMPIDHSHIVFRFSGVRPLPASSAATPGQISRDHSFPVIAPGDGVDFPIYSLIGGKWTTFRAFSEQVADALLKSLGKPRLTGSEHLAIGGGKDYPRETEARQRWLADAAAKTGLPEARLETLLDRYGTRAQAIAAFCAAGQDAPLRHHPGYTRREIEFIAANEQVIHLDDIILRRTLMAILGQVTRDLLDELAEIAAPGLGWTAETAQAEVERAAAILADRHGVVLRQSSAQSG